MTTIGDNVRRYRRQFGYSQHQLARLSGVHQPSISNIEAGKHDPHFDTVRKLAQGLGLPMSALVDEVPAGPPTPPKTPRTDERDEKFNRRFASLRAVDAGDLREELDGELTALQSYIRGLNAAGVGDEDFTLRMARGKLARGVRRLSAVTMLWTELGLGRPRKSFEEYAGAPDELERWLREQEQAGQSRLFNNGAEAG